MKLDEVVAWYQKKIGTYDKQEWEKTVEQKILNSFTSITLKNAKLKTEFIDVDLVRGSLFPKAKPKQALLTVIRLAFLRYLFLPIYAKWWVIHTSFKLFFICLILYICQSINWFIYIHKIYKFDANNEHIVSLSELIIPMILSFVLCLIYSLIVATKSSTSNLNSKNKHIFNKNGKCREKIRRRKKVIRNFVHIETSPESNSINKKNKDPLTAVTTAASTPITTTITTTSAGINLESNSIIDNNNDSRASSKKKTDELLSINSYNNKNNNNNSNKITNNILNQTEKLIKNIYFQDNVEDVSNDVIIKKRNVNWDSPIRNYVNHSFNADDFENYSSKNEIISHCTLSSSLSSSLLNKNDINNDKNLSIIEKTTNNLIVQNIINYGDISNNKNNNDSNCDKIINDDDNSNDVLLFNQKSPAALIIDDDGFESLNGKSSSGEENKLLCNHSNNNNNNGNDKNNCYSDKNHFFNSSKNLSNNSSIGTTSNSTCNNNITDNTQLVQSKNQLRQRFTFGKTRINNTVNNNDNKINTSNNNDHNPINDYDYDDDEDDDLSDEDLLKNNFNKFSKRYSIPMMRNGGSRSKKLQQIPDTDLINNKSNGRNFIKFSKLICKNNDGSTIIGESSSVPATITTSLSQLNKSNESSDINDNEEDDDTGKSPISLAGSAYIGCSASATEWLGVTTNSEECSYSSEPNSDLKEDSDEISDHEFAPNVLLNSHGSNDIISCTIWDRHDPKKAEMSVLDISSCIIERVEGMPESSDYIYIGVLFTILLSLIPSLCRLCETIIDWDTTRSEISYFDLPVLLWEKTAFSLTLITDLTYGKTNWEKAILILGVLQRFTLTFLLFFLFAVAERTFKQRFLYAKLFSHLTSSRRARKSNLPHFRLNKVRNIKTWLSVRSYLKRRGPQRSVDVIVSTAFSITMLLLGFLSVECLKDSVHFHSQLNLEALFWSGALGIYLLRFMTLGNKINRKYRSISVLITEQINLYLQIEQKPKKKDELMVANSVLKLAADLLKELESPFKISGLNANPYLFTTLKVVILSAFSGVLSEMLGFKLKLHKIKIK